MADSATAPAVRPIPEGYHTLTPTMTVHNAAQAIEFYKRAFGAQEHGRFPTPDGKLIAHAELQIGDSRLMLNDEMPGHSCQSPRTLGGSPAGLFLYVEDVDAVFQRAVEAGATVRMPVADMFWGDRFGTVTDPFGYDWGIATRNVNLSDEELKRRAAEAFAAQPA